MTKNLAQRSRSPQWNEPENAFEPRISRIDTDKDQDCREKSGQTSLPLFACIPSVGIRVIRGKMSSGFHRRFLDELA